MAHAIEEVEEMIHHGSQALVVNIGTLSKPWIESISIACNILLVLYVAQLF